MNNIAVRKEFKYDIQKLIFIMVAIGLLSSITLPPVSFGALKLYWVTIFSPVIFFLVVILFFYKPLLHLSSIIPLMLGCMVVFSAMTSWAFAFSSPAVGDILEAVKYFQFAPYLMALPFIRHGKALDELKIIIFICSLIVLFVGVVQYLQVDGVASYLSGVYLGEGSAHLDASVSGMRISITGSDPNVGAVIAYFFAFYYLSSFLEKPRFSFSLLFFCFVILALLTQSRTALLGFLFALSVYSFCFLRANFVFKILFFIISIFFFGGVIYFLDLQYITIGFQSAVEGQNNSLNVRMENIKDAYDRFSRFPLLGLGPAKSEFSTIIDSEYALIMQRYGLVGFLLFFMYLSYVFYLAKKAISSRWGGGLFMFSSSSVVVMGTNNIFSGYQLMSIVVLLTISCILANKLDLAHQRGI